MSASLIDWQLRQSNLYRSCVRHKNITDACADGCTEAILYPVDNTDIAPFHIYILQSYTDIAPFHIDIVSSYSANIIIRQGRRHAVFYGRYVIDF